MTDAYVHVMVDPGAVTRAAEEIGGNDNVEAVHLTTGEWDLIVRLDLDSKENIALAVTEDIHSVGGVFDTDTSVAFEP